MSQLTAALNSSEPPWRAREAPGDHYTFAGEIPWHSTFAAEPLAESGPNTYRGHVRGTNAEFEILAHEFSWGSHHSEMNQAGGARIPSHDFSMQFDLRGLPQSFDQCLPDGTRATVTLSGVDGLEGDVLYIREDLLFQYIGDRAIVWFASGERELRPYPQPTPKWLIDLNRAQTSAWRSIQSEADLRKSSSSQPVAKKAKAKNSSSKKAPKQAAKRMNRTGNKS